MTIVLEHPEPITRDPGLTPQSFVPKPTSRRQRKPAQPTQRPWIDLVFGKEPFAYRLLIWATRNRVK